MHRVPKESPKRSIEITSRQQPWRIYDTRPRRCSHKLTRIPGTHLGRFVIFIYGVMCYRGAVQVQLGGCIEKCIKSYWTNRGTLVVVPTIKVIPMYDAKAMMPCRRISYEYRTTMAVLLKDVRCNGEQAVLR